MVTPAERNLAAQLGIGFRLSRFPPVWVCGAHLAAISIALRTATPLDDELCEDDGDDAMCMDAGESEGTGEREGASESECESESSSASSDRGGGADASDGPSA
eukprot:2694516-Pleurochrysis_carterae.AAC.1